MKSVSIFLVLFVFFLVVLEAPMKIEAGDKFKCVVEYGGDVGPTFCNPKFFSRLCRENCRTVRGAKGGKCVKQPKHKPIKCFCDYCKDEDFQETHQTSGFSFNRQTQPPLLAV